MGTFLQKTTPASATSIHYMASTMVISISARPSSLSWHNIQKRTEAISIHTKLPIYYGIKEINASS